MLTLELESSKPHPVAHATLGQAFLYFRDDQSRLALRIEDAGGQPAWMDISGDEAFNAFRLEGYGFKVTPITRPGLTCSLRLDERSSATNFNEHKLGQVVVSPEEGFCIAVKWSFDQSERNRDVLPLSGWKLTSCVQPKHMFDRWALGYVDAAGKWNDLIDRL